MKKSLVVFFLAVISIYGIYNLAYDKKFNYLVIGDELASGHTPFDTYGPSYVDYVYDYIKTEKKEAIINKTFIKEDLRIKDLIEELKNPNKEEKETLPSLVNHADIITISIGSEELFSKLRSNKNLYLNDNKKIYNYIDDMTKEFDELLMRMRKITNKPIYLVGYYSPFFIDKDTETNIDSIFNYIDTKFKMLEKNYNITYISTYSGFKDNAIFLPNIDHAFPSIQGYEYIADKIIEKIKAD